MKAHEATRDTTTEGPANERPRPRPSLVFASGANAPPSPSYRHPGLRLSATLANLCHGSTCRQPGPSSAGHFLAPPVGRRIEARSVWIRLKSGGGELVGMPNPPFSLFYSDVYESLNIKSKLHRGFRTYSEVLFMSPNSQIIHLDF